MTNDASGAPRAARVIVRAYGETPLDAIAEHTSLEEATVPSAADLEGDDVLIEVRSAAVGWVDLLMTSGQYQHMPELPYTPGMEYSGVVAALGPDVERSTLAVGDPVLVDGFLTGPRSSGRHQRYGGFATHALAPARAVRRIPGELTFDQACNLLGNYETAYHCLVHNGQLLAGETVLVHGASGATGLAAVHVAKLLGATVIATGRRDDKLALVREQGADHVINIAPATAPGSGESTVRRFRDEVKELTGGRGVDVVYDGVGGDVSVESLRCVRFGARFLIVGWASTPFVARGRGERGAPNANVLPTNLIMMKGLRVLGCPTVIATQHDPSLRNERLARIWSWAAAGDIRPYVSHRFALRDYAAAMRAKWSGEVVGGCVLNPVDVSAA